MRATRVGSVNERFEQRYVKNAETGCWDWTGRKNAKGYGQISGVINGKRYAPIGKSLLAHRASWLLYKGEIPSNGSAHGTVVMHICDNPSCVNPDHLRLGTQSDNVRDMIAKGRKVSGVPSGVRHWNSAFKSQADIDLICSTKGKTKELAEEFGVDVCTIKRIRRRNGAAPADGEKYANKRLPQDAIDYIRSTPPGTRGLAKLFGVSKETISKIRKGVTHAR